MPQASDRLRSKMEQMFGDPVDDEGPAKFLTDAGYTLTKEWTWRKEGVEELWEMKPEELACLQFLIDEWDFGGLSHG
jgi:hypothetical protein